MVDNGSPDGTPDRLTERFPAVRLIRNATNRGFGHGVQPGRRSRDCTARLLPQQRRDRRSRLAGSAVDARSPSVTTSVRRCRASTSSTAACSAPGRWSAGMARCSSTAMARRPAIPPSRFPAPSISARPRAWWSSGRRFLACGGFSADYAPAYYEDADLCMTLAARGLRTVYVPASHVRHARYGSGDAAEARALSERNRTSIRSSAGPARCPVIPPRLTRPRPQRVLAARDAGATGRVLVLASGAPRSPGEEWLLALQSLLPWARVTLVAEVAPTPRGSAAASRCSSSRSRTCSAAGAFTMTPSSPTARDPCRRRWSTSASRRRHGCLPRRRSSSSRSQAPGCYRRRFLPSRRLAQRLTCRYAGAASRRCATCASRASARCRCATASRSARSARSRCAAASRARPATSCVAVSRLAPRSTRRARSVAT